MGVIQCIYPPGCWNLREYSSIYNRSIYPSVEDIYTYLYLYHIHIYLGIGVISSSTGLWLFSSQEIKLEEVLSFPHLLILLVFLMSKGAKMKHNLMRKGMIQCSENVFFPSKSLISLCLRWKFSLVLILSTPFAHPLWDSQLPKSPTSCCLCLAPSFSSLSNVAMLWSGLDLP